MPPRPPHDIDFPALGDEIRDLLLALWTFVCDLGLVIWSYVSQAFSVVWTYPPFEAFRNELVAALIDLTDYVVAHPVTSAAIVVLAFVVIPATLKTLKLCLVHCLRPRRRSVLRGSYTANYQSTSYGGNVPRRLTFAQSQTHGAKGGGRYRTTR